MYDGARKQQGDWQGEDGVVAHPLFIPSYTDSFWVGPDSSILLGLTGLCTLSCPPALFNHLLQ